MGEGPKTTQVIRGEGGKGDVFRVEGFNDASVGRINVRGRVELVAKA